MSEAQYAVVMTTAASVEEAQKITDSLLEKKLAACVQLINISSHYFWDNTICNSPEILLLIKCKASLYSQIEECIKSDHSYDVPEIICVPILNGAPPYLNWIDEVSISTDSARHI